MPIFPLRNYTDVKKTIGCFRDTHATYVQLTRRKLAMTGRRETDRQLFGCDLESLLWTGIILADFQIEGEFVLDRHSM